MDSVKLNSIKRGTKFLGFCELLLSHISALSKGSLGKCIATTAYFSKILNKSERQIYRYLEYLRKTGQIQIETTKLRRNLLTRKPYKIRIIAPEKQCKSMKPLRNLIFRKMHGNRRNKIIKNYFNQMKHTLKQKSITVDCFKGTDAWIAWVSKHISQYKDRPPEEFDNRLNNTTITEFEEFVKTEYPAVKAEQYKELNAKEEKHHFTEKEKQMFEEVRLIQKLAIAEQKKQRALERREAWKQKYLYKRYTYDEVRDPRYD